MRLVLPVEVSVKQTDYILYAQVVRSSKSDSFRVPLNNESLQHIVKHDFRCHFSRLHFV